jgi:hypothetical protein
MNFIKEMLNVNWKREKEGVKGPRGQGVKGKRLKGKVSRG